MWVNASILLEIASMSEGPKGRAKGGVARAEKLSAEERIGIAKAAADARWKFPKASHIGQLHIGDLGIDCAVLPDGTRVLSQRGVGKALGRGFGGADWRRQGDVEGGAKVPFFLNATSLKKFIPNDLLQLVTEPIQYRHSKGGGIAFGIPATALPMICDVWLKARDEGVLNKSQLEVAVRADLLMRGLAHIGVIALVDEATGYQEVRDRLALQQILDKFLTAERAKWAKTFPNEFYQKLFRLKGWNYDPGSMKRPGVVGHYTNDIIYDRLAPGILKKVQELNPKTETGNRKAKHHQFFTADYGIPELKQHLTNVMFLMDAAGNDWNLFKTLISRAAPKQGDTLLLDLQEPD
jgi:P63C domain